MSKVREPFVGEDINRRWGFRDGSGKQADAQDSVFPILRQRPTAQWEVVGTGFFITKTGIFVTAKHVLEAVFERKGNQTHAPALVHLLASDQCLIRPILRAAMHPTADLAVGVAAPMKHNPTGESLANQRLTLTDLQPRMGTPVATYAYPNATVSIGTGVQRIELWPAFYEGEVLEYYPNGRDNVLLPRPCYHTSIFLHGGASGGPVFGTDGRVFAVNSTGFQNERTSFVSAIQDILSLSIDDVLLLGESVPRSVAVLELAHLGHIAFDPPLGPTSGQLCSEG